MDVAISSFRAELSQWLERVRTGDEVVITDRGTPVARLLPVDSSSLLERLTREGVLSRPQIAARPAAQSIARVRSTGPVSELIEQQRR